MTDIEKLMKDVAEGKVSPDAAVLKLKKAPFEDLGFAKPDLHRALRQGVPEVIYGAGKNAAQIDAIADRLIENGAETVLITRIDSTREAELRIPHRYFADARIAIAGAMPEIRTEGVILIATGGTSDIPVAEEAAVTAEALGNRVNRLYDVGVAGLHRLLSHDEDIMNARVIIVVAGMEGALASVVGGLADAPVIAVPTSVGYGASFGGLSALLSMLNSCASGVSVVNIDNGFGAGYMASMINHLGEKA
jgi:NCAIR mutase (PurE)-related protein